MIAMTCDSLLLEVEPMIFDKEMPTIFSMADVDADVAHLNLGVTTNTR